MKYSKTILIMGLFSYLFGCGQSKNTNLSPDYQLVELSQEQVSEFNSILTRSKEFIEKYVPEDYRETEIIDSKNLDAALDNWRESTDTEKESPEDVIELLGCALGNDIVNSLNCEWMVLTDEYGTDFTVIHKKYKINGFPFSSVMKAIEQGRVGSLNEIKLTIKENIELASNSREYDERN